VLRCRSRSDENRLLQTCLSCQAGFPVVWRTSKCRDASALAELLTALHLGLTTVALVHADASGYKPLNADLSMGSQTSHRWDDLSASDSGECRLADAHQRDRFSPTTTAL
jgi:hypothetical protein